MSITAENGMVQSLAKVHLRALAERPVSPSVDPEEG